MKYKTGKSSCLNSMSWNILLNYRTEIFYNSDKRATNTWNWKFSFKLHNAERSFNWKLSSWNYIYLLIPCYWLAISRQHFWAQMSFSEIWFQKDLQSNWKHFLRKFYLAIQKCFLSFELKSLFFQISITMLVETQRKYEIKFILWNKLPETSS